jgi:hypothetical protein
LALESLAAAIERLEARGFVHSLRAGAGALRVVGGGERHAPEDLRIDEIVRFEGDTDPAEELVLFALSAPDGSPLGTYAALFGPATPPEDAEVVRRLGARRRRRPGVDAGRGSGGG